MNQVLFLMYLADLATGISVLCCIVGIVLLCVYAFRWMVNLNDEFGENAVARTMPPKRALWIVLILFCVSAAMPSKATLYAVAAVQAGDTLANTERGAKVIRALDAWLDQQASGEDQ